MSKKCLKYWDSIKVVIDGFAQVPESEINSYLLLLMKKKLATEYPDVKQESREIKMKCARKAGQEIRGVVESQVLSASHASSMFLEREILSELGSPERPVNGG